MKYFVVAIGGSNLPLPIVNEDDEIELFNTYTQAEEMAEHQIICSARGYEIYKWPHANH